MQQPGVLNPNGSMAGRDFDPCEIVAREIKVEYSKCRVKTAQQKIQLIWVTFYTAIDDQGAYAYECIHQ